MQEILCCLSEATVGDIVFGADVRNLLNFVKGHIVSFVIIERYRETVIILSILESRHLFEK